MYKGLKDLKISEKGRRLKEVNFIELYVDPGAESDPSML